MRNEQIGPWTIGHFSQSNPSGANQGDVPALLRRVADTIEGLGDVEIHDLTFGTDVNEDGPWHRITVYFDERYQDGAADT